MMRALIAAFVLAAAPAAAQIYQSPAERAGGAEAARFRDIELTNRLSVLESRMSSEEALRDLQAQSQRPVLVQPNPNSPPPMVDTGQLTSIPDKTLADSNARVRAAAANRR